MEKSSSSGVDHGHDQLHPVDLLWLIPEACEWPEETPAPQEFLLQLWTDLISTYTI